MEKEREWGEQPLIRLMAEHGLKGHDLVVASAEPMTHKMVARACKGRWLTMNTRRKVLQAMCKASAGSYAMEDLFNYR